MSKEVAGHRCEGYKYWTSAGYEYGCKYETDICCDECVFVVGKYEHDYRKGRKPWGKIAQSKERMK